METSNEQLYRIDLNGDHFNFNKDIVGREVSMLWKGDEKITASAIFRKQLLSKDLPTIKKEFVNRPNSIVLCQYISRDARQVFKDQGINYLDSVGNIFFQSDQKLIFIEKNRNASSVVKQKTSRAFTKTGLKLLYSLLKHPSDINKGSGDDESELVNTRYLNMASEAGVSTDTVSKVIKQLLLEGYLVRIDKKNYKWNNKEELFHKWIEGYNRTLRPNLEREIAAPINEKDWRTARLKEHSYWGGSIAANRINNRLIINRGIIYTHKDHYQILRENLWFPKEDGQVTIYEAFWPENGGNAREDVHPFITYADLLHSNDPRQIEVAHEIYEKEIQPRLL